MPHPVTVPRPSAVTSPGDGWGLPAEADRPRPGNFPEKARKGTLPLVGMVASEPTIASVGVILADLDGREGNFRLVSGVGESRSVIRESTGNPCLVRVYVQGMTSQPDAHGVSGWITQKPAKRRENILNNHLNMHTFMD